MFISAWNYERISIGGAASSWVLADYPNCTCVFYCHSEQFRIFHLWGFQKKYVSFMNKVFINFCRVKFRNFSEQLSQNVWRKHILVKKNLAGFYLWRFRCHYCLSSLMKILLQLSEKLLWAFVLSLPFLLDISWTYSQLAKYFSKFFFCKTDMFNLALDIPNQILCLWLVNVIWKPSGTNNHLVMFKNICRDLDRCYELQRKMQLF